MRAITYSLNQETLANTAARMLQRITGDRCFAVRVDKQFVIIRFDAAGKEVTC